MSRRTNDKHYALAARSPPPQYDFLPVKMPAPNTSCRKRRGARGRNGTARATAEAFGSTEGNSPLLRELWDSIIGLLPGESANPSNCTQPGTGRHALERKLGSAEERENVSGGFVAVGTDSDPITGLFALSNQCSSSRGLRSMVCGLDDRQL
jgi:hypothetical protein